jgi:hypothetical protein
MRKALIYLLPLAVFLIVSVFLLRGLWLNPREVPSPLIDKPAPMFSLTQLARPDARFSPADMKGQVWLLNVWLRGASPAPGAPAAGRTVAQEGRADRRAQL